MCVLFAKLSSHPLSHMAHTFISQLKEWFLYFVCMWDSEEEPLHLNEPASIEKQVPAALIMRSDKAILLCLFMTSASVSSCERFFSNGYNIARVWHNAEKSYGALRPTKLAVVQLLADRCDCFWFYIAFDICVHCLIGCFSKILSKFRNT